MSLVSLVFGIGFTKSTIGTIELDAMTNEKIELKSEATKYFVEEGAPVSDHIIIDNETLSIEGIISASDISIFGEGRSRMISAVDALRGIKDSRQVVSIVTGLGLYTDMVMVNCSITRSSSLQQIEVVADFTKIRKTEKKEADVPEVKSKGTAKGKAGATKTKAGKVASTSNASNIGGAAGKNATGASATGPGTSILKSQADKIGEILKGAL